MGSAQRVAQLEVGRDRHGLEHGDVLLQQVLLHDVPGELAEDGRVTGAAVDVDGARGVARLVARQHVEQRRLAGSRRAQDGRELPGPEEAGHTSQDHL